MNQAIDKLLIEFDEMGFAPTNVCDDPEGKAKLWKSALVYEIGLFLDEHAAIRKKAVKEFAEKLKTKAHSVVGFNVRKKVYAKEYTINEIDIDEVLKEYEK